MILLGWVKSFAIFVCVLVSGKNFRILRESNWCYTQHLVWTSVPQNIICSNPWLTSWAHNTSTTKWRWRIKVWDQRTGRKVASLSIYSRFISLGLLLELIHGSLPVLTILQPPRGGGSFSEGVLDHLGQELESSWVPRNDHMTSIDGVTH